MSQIFRFSGALKRDPAISAWMDQHSDELGAIARRWFGVMRDCGEDVREILHDGHPTACVADAAFAYVDAFKAHVNVGFFRGAELADPAGLLEGSGKSMRHVKLRPDGEIDATALTGLIRSAYAGMKLALITANTLEHYNRRAAEFWEGTRDHDVKQNVEALLRHVRGAPPLRILDLGCGPGRDLATFRALGHEPIGLEGSPPLAAMAREHSGCEVWEQDFLALKLPAGHFDGIFANASLFHVPSRALPRVLGELHAALKPGGVLFTSNPRGNNEEGWNRGRYGAYHDLASWRGFLERAAFAELEHYYRPPGLPREQQPWLASVWRRR